MKEQLISFPLSRDEPPSGQNVLNLYGRMRTAASNVISTFLPEDQESLDQDIVKSSATPSVNNDSPSDQSAFLTVNSNHKSQPSVALTDDLADLQQPEPIPLTDGDHSDVESMFSTASYSLSKAYLANHYRQGRKRALNSLGREFWMKDENAKTCFRCLKSFTTFRRRHHCRVCGQIFCSGCTKLIPGSKFHQQRNARIRCCLNCLNSLTSQHSSSEDEDQISVFDESPTRDRTPRSVNIPQTRHLEEYHFSPRSGTSGQINTPNLSPNGRYIIPVYSDVDEEDVHPQLFTRSRSNTRSSVRSSTFVPPPAQPRHSVATAIFPTTNKQESITLNDAAMEHLQQFLERVLFDSELSTDTWKQVLVDNLLHLADTIRVDNVGKDPRAEPREWVKLKRVPGGTPQDIECINGIIFTHNFALRDMPQVVQNPKILVITFPLEYSRGESKYMSLTPVLAQETEFLKKLIGRIETLRPTVLLSSSHISGIALRLLHDAGIAVATGIRDYALTRLSRYVQTEPLTSMDRLSISPPLGTCDRLEVRTYREDSKAKSFLFFTGIPTTGTTVMLRGDESETKMVKAVMEIMLDVSFSLKLETYLMRDQFVRIPDHESIDIQKVLSSSPFVNFGRPYLEILSGQLEDRLVLLNNSYSDLRKLEASAQNGRETSGSGDEMPIDSSKLLLLREQYPDPLPGGDQMLVRIGCTAAQCEKDAAYREWTDAKQQWEQMEAANPYMFNPGPHQNLVYSFFLYCQKTNMPCVGPDTCVVDYYMDSDTPLGLFVENCCNTFNDLCPDGCPNILGDHFRCYFHGNGMVKISTLRQACGITGLQDTILMWNKCKICDTTTAFTPMSACTWHYSFGKYLELSFWGEPLRLRAATCEHNIYRDFMRYFSWHNITIEVEYSPIELFDVYTPTVEAKWSADPLIRIKIQTYKEFRERILRLWSSVIESLSKVQVEGLDEEKFQEATQQLQAIKEMAEKDKTECIVYLDDVFNKLDATDYLGLNIVLRFVQSLVSKYHAEFNNFDGLFFPSEKDIRRVTVQQLKGMLLDDDKKVLSSSDTERQAMSDSNASIVSEKVPGVSKPADLLSADDYKDNEAHPVGAVMHSTVSSIASVPTDVGPSHSNTMDAPVSSASSRTNNVAPSRVQSPFDPSGREASVPVQSKFGTHISLSIAGLQQQIPTAQDSNRRNKVSFLARHFEELSKEFEKERKREHQRLLDRQEATAIKQTQPIATVFKDVNEAVHDDHDGYDEEEDADDSDADADDEDDGADEDEQNEPSEAATADEPPVKSLAPPGGVEKKSLIQSLVDFWAERSSTRWSGIEDMMKPNEHIFSDSIVVIREVEPSSLIAFCLSLPDYKERVDAIYLGEDALSQEQVLLRQKSVHLKYNFVNGTTTMSCKIFFSEQFDALRKQTKCSANFVQSLSRCNPFESSGGKSGSVFLKTTDDRFILKSISQAEFDSLTNFAPSYFNYMSQALFHELPTALAKLFGVFQVHIRTATSNIRMYLVISENLFPSGGNFTRFFDLKGSMRNRKAAETGKANEVLLDENMVDYIYENPVFVREHSKRILRACIYNDTLFLTKMNVMDYSLVIGIDEDSNMIRAGIIDYIRAFTWDKKVESWVKGRTTHGAKEPTVISPKQYKVRFRESMEHYFQLVPDCWHQVHQSPST